MSLLDIIANPVEGAAVLCNLPAPTSVISSSDPNVPLLLRLANQEGRELARRHDWRDLMVDHTQASVATEIQTALPTAYDRLIAYPEVWNRSLGLPYSGPTSPRTWGTLKGLAVTSAQPGWWRLTYTGTPRLPTIEITPAPTAGETLALYYVSKNWCISPANVDQDHWVSDTDESIIPQRLITLGVVWRYKKSKGLDYAEDMSTYEREVERACSRDKAAGVIRPRSTTRGDLPPYSWTGTVTP